MRTAAIPCARINQRRTDSKSKHTNYQNHMDIHRIKDIQTKLVTSFIHEWNIHNSQFSTKKKGFWAFFLSF